ncbi:MAG: NADH-quinone oxidoreductase subunit H, partial [Planctomycetes bacterium]|nr:NADH-quinone oxidoreductase subunit H [Planctomycetota bacterium]
FLIFGILPISPMFDGKMLVAGDFDFSILLLVFLLCTFVYFTSEYFENKSLLILTLTIAVVSILCVVMSAESFKVSNIVYSQIADSDGKTKYSYMVLPAWFAFRQPFAFLVFVFNGIVLFNLLKNTNKTNYRVLKALEIPYLLTFAAITVVIFLGSWHFPTLPVYLKSQTSSFLSVILCIVVFQVKFLIVAFVFIRLKSVFLSYDTRWLQNLLCRIAFPISIINLVYMLIIQ